MGYTFDDRFEVFAVNLARVATGLDANRDEVDALILAVFERIWRLS